jgi:hypothetical protein
MEDYDTHWQLSIGFHWPHQRLALGWEVINPSEEFNYTTITLYLFVITISLDF